MLSREQFKGALEGFAARQEPPINITYKEVEFPGKSYYGIVAGYDSKINACMQFEDVYRNYLEGESIAEIIDALKKNLIDSDIKKIINIFNAGLEGFKEYLYVSVCSLEEAKKHGLMHIPQKDLAIIAELRYTNGEYTGNIKFRESMLTSMKLSKEELFDIAFRNSEEKVPMEWIDDLIPFFYILTNAEHYKGAAVLFYPDIMKKIYSKIGPYFLIPSSVHEWIIVSEKYADIRELLKLNYEVNNNPAVVSPEEVLINNCYHFSPEHGFEMAEEFISREL